MCTGHKFPHLFKWAIYRKDTCLHVERIEEALNECLPSIALLSYNHSTLHAVPPRMPPLPFPNLSRTGLLSFSFLFVVISFLLMLHNDPLPSSVGLLPVHGLERLLGEIRDSNRHKRGMTPLNPSSQKGIFLFSYLPVSKQRWGGGGEGRRHIIRKRGGKRGRDLCKVVRSGLFCRHLCAARL